MSDRARRIHDLTYSCESRTEMCERVVDMEDECKRLRERFENVFDECERLRSCLSDASENAKLIMDENAKLRNLIHILCHCMQIHAECDDCRLNGAKGELAFDPLCACDGLHELLREAGIEVN